MQNLILTSPVTGAEFSAIEISNGDIICTNKLTGEAFTLIYDAASDRYSFPAAQLQPIKMMTLDACADEMGITRPRVSKLVKQKRLPSATFPATVLVPEYAVLEYIEHQKEWRAKHGKRTGTADR